MVDVKFLTPTQIESIAVRVRELFNCKDELSLDITKLAKDVGLEVFEAEFSDSNVTGKIEGLRIYVNKNDSEARKRFTIAHELAHYLLHQNGDINHVDYRKSREYYSEEELKREFQANMLAASLLMPKKLVEKKWRELQDIDEIAAAFKVSKKAASVRLDSLHLLDS